MGAKKKPVKKKTAPKKSAPKKSAPKKSAPKKSTTTKRVTAAPKKKAAAPKKKAAAPKKKAAAPKKKAAAPKKSIAKKKSAAPKTTATAKAVAKNSPALQEPSRRTRTLIGIAPPPGMARPPAERPSERAMAVAAQLPTERALTDEEREAMSKVALTALAALQSDGAHDGAPEVIVDNVGTFVDEIRAGRRPEPKSQDVRLGLGVLWGEQVRAQVGWRWVHLSYPNGFASYALVPDDRAFACFPLNRLTELMKSGADGANTLVPLFDSIRVGVLPTRRSNAYLVIG